VKDEQDKTAMGDGATAAIPKDINARAEAAAKARIEAMRKRQAGPNVHGDVQPDRLTEIARQEIPEAFWSGPKDKKNPRGTKPPTKHAFWALTADLHRSVNKGYRVQMRDGFAVQHNEHTLTWIEDEIAQDQRAQGEKESRERLDSARALGGEADKDETSKRGMSEEISVTRGGK